MEIQWNSVEVMLKAPSGPEHGSFLPSVHSTANFDLVQVTDTFTGEQKPFCVQTGYAAVASSLFSVGPVGQFAGGGNLRIFRLLLHPSFFPRS